jgi:hypothetical protein
MDHVVGPLHILLAEKEVRIWFNTISLKLYQFERITWWCLSILEYVMESACNLSWNLSYWKNIFKKSRSPGFASCPPLGGGLNENPGSPCNLIHSPPCRTPCKLCIHEVFFGPLNLHLRMWSELVRSPPFRPTRALRLQWLRASSPVCEVALS